uniref:Reverse transcriptase zinc-binding domain-containing protein n=1 Tax=Cannabis sativa TaxID=3483 RepID=A0A803Q8S3_CANSA
MGDFNDYLSLSDKIGGNMSRAPSAQFQSFIDNHELHPLTPLGNLFTWTNRQKQPNHTQERLDWCLSNNAWDAIFPDSQLNHGDFFGSDHRPLILTLQYMNGHRNQKPRFIFDKLWMSEPGFEDCLRDAWTQTNPNPHPNPLIGLKERLTTCSSRLTLWKQSLGPPIATQIRITERLTLAEIALLQATFTAIEIKTATFQLAHEKAPGLDGFNDSFFQKNWHLLGQDVTAAALNFLNGDADLSTVNQTLIVLIPKRPNPEQITDYRPISLCSTFYKIISRVLVNRLKPILSRIISPSQSAFLPSRLISDNIIIGQEVMHSLTHRGKEVLLKSVVQAIPSYAMACFKLPASFHSKIESLMALFWWGGNENNRKIHWKTWSSLCFSKFHGGLGFRSMKAFNQAMLAKQAWRLLQYPHSLVAILLKARYFPQTSFLHSGKGHRPSLVWSSITWGKELLQSGLRKSIGDGTTINIFNDAWIPGYGKLHYLRYNSNADMTVASLLTPDKQWNHALIHSLFPSDISQAITAIPLHPISTQDTYFWSLTPHGSYTVNSGYHLAHTQLHQNEPSSSDSKFFNDWWKKLWALPLPPKLKHFLWRVCYDILPTSRNLFNRKTLHSPHCSRCHYHDETLEHALFRCPASQKVWNLTDFNNFINAHCSFNCMDLLYLAATEFSTGHYSLFVCLLWKLWNCRNSWIHDGISPSPDQVLREISTYMEQYTTCNKKTPTFSPASDDQCLHNNNCPSTSTFHHRLLVDAAQDSQLLKMGFGMTIHTSSGEVLLNLAKPQNGITTPLIMEAHTLYSAISWCHEHSFYPDSIVSDCSVLVNYICKNESHNLHLNPFAIGIKSLLSFFPNVSLSYIPRGSNLAAHCLAKTALGLEQEALWMSPTVQNALSHVSCTSNSH